jgi:hypothetical protein
MAKSKKTAASGSGARTGAEPADTTALRRQLIKLLDGGSAHATFESAVEDFPPELRGKAPRNAPHTAWELLEHMRIAQRDILEFSCNPDYRSPDWPSGYWPESRSPGGAAAWDRSVKSFQTDLKAFKRLISDPESNLLAPIDHPEAPPDANLLREALLIADHNAYHLGELIFLRRLLGAWRSG